MQTIKSFLRIVIIVGTFTVLMACDNNVTAPDVDANIDPALLSIRVGAVESGNKVYVRIPIEIYGSEESLEGSGLDIYRNGALLISNISVKNYFQRAQNDIGLYVSGITAGTTLGFFIKAADGSDLYYEGTVSAETEIKAALSIFPDFNVGTEIADFFESHRTVSGSASGAEFTGTYSVNVSYAYSSECEMDFVFETSFSGEGKDKSDIDSILSIGEYKLYTIDIFHSDGDIVWDNEDPLEEDYAGVINADGSFTIFTGDYVDESNYTYTLIQGSLDADQGSISGNIVRTIVLDGTKLELDAVGSCTASGMML